VRRPHHDDDDGWAAGTNSSERWTRGKFASLNNTTGCYVNVLYLFVKLLFVANAFCQFVALNNFLDTDDHWWGLQVRSLARLLLYSP